MEISEEIKYERKQIFEEHIRLKIDELLSQIVTFYMRRAVTKPED